MTTPLRTTIPPGLPVLTPGKHRGPIDGSCLMEYVSVLAGARFSDHPRCTHPLLGWLARRVNDRVGAVERPRLAALAPALIGTRVPGPRARGLVRAVVYGELAAVALTAVPDDAWLVRLHDQAGSHGTPRAPRPLATVDRNLVFETVLEAVADLDPADRDRLLVAALARSVTRARRGLGLSDTTGARPARRWDGSRGVRTADA